MAAVASGRFESVNEESNAMHAIIKTINQHGKVAFQCSHARLETCIAMNVKRAVVAARTHLWVRAAVLRGSLLGAMAVHIPCHQREHAEYPRVRSCGQAKTAFIP